MNKVDTAFAFFLYVVGVAIGAAIVTYAVSAVLT